MKCKNYTCDCDNATICPCLLHEECDNYCHSCRQNFTETKDGLYYHHCKLKENDQSYINDYTKWFASEISSTEMREFHEITLPFFDINNDYIQIYAKQEGDNIVLSDDGYTLFVLGTNGFEIIPIRKQLICSILSQFGVSLEDNTLSMTIPANEFPQKIHMFAQAMLAVNSLYRVVKSYAEERSEKI